MQNYEQHRQKVSKMRALTVVREPQQPEFVFLKPKLEMARRGKAGLT